VGLSFFFDADFGFFCFMILLKFEQFDRPHCADGRRWGECRGPADQRAKNPGGGDD
jgi:hypothetical protein